MVDEGSHRYVWQCTGAGSGHVGPAGAKICSAVNVVGAESPKSGVDPTRNAGIVNCKASYKPIWQVRSIDLCPARRGVGAIEGEEDVSVVMTYCHKG